MPKRMGYGAFFMRKGYFSNIMMNYELLVPPISEFLDICLVWCLILDITMNYVGV